LDKKFPFAKRFSLEGSESLIPLLDYAIEKAGEHDVDEVLIGMAHRGRLNVLVNIMDKPPAQVFREFRDVDPELHRGSGDVKYHLGFGVDRVTPSGRKVHLSLCFNPSHLAFVGPVALGRARAKQDHFGDLERRRALTLLIHGDAAFAGQGVVAETLNMAALEGYEAGGVIRVVINNQIGFTTDPRDSRSGLYATDVASVLGVPVFHVNGDDPEAAAYVAQLAVEWRERFHRDVIIDLICYRQFGHNEGDEPGFTQPLMYKAIADHPSTREIYAKQLVDEGTLKAAEPDQIVQAFHDQLELEYEAAASYKPNEADWLGGAWSGMTTATADDRRGTTSVPLDTLRDIGAKLTRVPDGFNVNSKIARQLKAKAKMLESGKGIDWATAEALAFGTLVAEGYPVRLSGQDSGRGTFSQRHSVLIDQQTEERYIPLNNLAPGQALYEVHDSPLSEFAVLGYEYGYSLAEPKALTLWEAQFGDFANGAQVMIDQFISAGEAKWLRMSGLVMLLPHGYEGQGPEHSSARLERFLQMSGGDNWQVVYPTTPANYFHVLRRQIHRAFRKPLVVMTPKSLLRHKECVSDLAMFAEGSSFHRVLYEDVDLAPAKKVRRVVLCSGKVYFDLKKARDERGIDDVTIIRLEQLYPFPAEALGEELEKYPNADVVWCQEEPHNMGAWYFVDRKIEALLADIGHKAKRPHYAGRPDAAAPATGLLRRHTKEQDKLVDAALKVD